MTLPTKPTVHLVGMGSMGALLATYLLQYTNTEIIPLFRNRDRLFDFQKSAKSTIGIRPIYLGDSAAIISKTIPTSHCPETFDCKDIQNLVVTTKTYQTKDALAPYLPYINSETNLILIQNGLGVLEVLRDEIFTDVKQRPNIFQGVISHGAFQDKGFIFNHAGFADIKIARLPWDDKDLVQSNDFIKVDANENSLVRILTEPKFAEKFDCKHMTYQELLFGQLFKFLINSCINPVTAIVDCDNGEFADNCEEIFTSIIDESLSILSIAYKPLFDYENAFKNVDGYPNLDINSILNTEYMVPETIRIGCILNGKNSSSMRQDTRYLRDTEIDYINGYVVKLAQKLDLGADAAKTNKTIAELARLRLGLNRTRAANGEWKYR